LGLKITLYTSKKAEKSGEQENWGVLFVERTSHQKYREMLFGY
jgi:hypothetical protein